MTIKTKTITLDDCKYKIRQHPATEGCLLLEKHWHAIWAFNSVSTQPAYQVANKKLVQFSVVFNPLTLGLFMFLDRVLVPEQLELPPVQAPNSRYLTIAEIKAGTALADREEPTEELREPLPLSYAVDYKHSEKTFSVDASKEYQALEPFFRHTTLDDEEVDIDSLPYDHLAILLGQIITFNFMGVWSKKRFELPANWNSGTDTPASVQRARSSYSQSSVIYTILQAKLALATHADLMTVLNTEDAYDMNESALIAYHAEAEAFKEAERQAKLNKQG